MKDCITINKLAKILSGRGYAYGQNNLAEYMRTMGWLMYDYDNSLIPKQTEIDADRMLYETYMTVDAYGRGMECGRTLITMKGLRYYYQKITGSNYDTDAQYKVLPESGDISITLTISEGKYNMMSMIASSSGETVEQYILKKACI